MDERLEQIELSPYCDDIYSFAIYKYHLRHKFNPKNRKKSDIIKFLKEANITLDELLEEWKNLQGDDWETFQSIVDVQVGNYMTPAELGVELGLSAGTINKRLSEAGIPKYNNCEDNPFGKRYIPDAIKGRLVEIILDNTR